MIEQELISLLKRGDELAFKELVNNYQNNVFNTAIGMVQSAEDAEDIAQEVFIQVYKSIQNFKENALLSTWIYRITVNKSLDFLQKKKSKKRFAFVTSLWDKNDRTVHEPVNFVHPGVLLDNKEQATALFKLVNRLPENQKTAFVLNKIEDLGYSEIAGIMNTTESAVDSLLSRAKQNLKKMLEAK